MLALLKINGRTVRFQLDCGAECNIIRQEDLPPNASLANTTKLLRMHDGSIMRPTGLFRGTVVNPKNSQEYKEDFIVVLGGGISLLGAKTCMRMDLLRVQNENIVQVHSSAEVSSTTLTKELVLSQFADLFDDKLGQLEGAVKLEVDPDITPVKMPLRRCPVALRDKLKAELERLESIGVLERVETASDWISCVVTETKKDGSLRICVDPRPLNRALKRCHYPMPIVDDILPDLARTNVFSVLDLRSGFWHVQLDDSSSQLATMGTPAGRFRWKRMPFGIAPGPEIFQQKLDEAVSGLKGAKVIVDDILVYGEGETVAEAERDHDQCLTFLLHRARERA